MAFSSFVIIYDAFHISVAQSTVRRIVICNNAEKKVIDISGGFQTLRTGVHPTRNRRDGSGTFELHEILA